MGAKEMSGHVQSFLVEELGEQEQAVWLERGNAERGCSLAKAQSTLCVRSLPERLGERRKQVDAALDFDDSVELWAGAPLHMDGGM